MDKPDLFPWLNSTYEAFIRLSACREYSSGGMSRPFPQPIRMESILAYASSFGMRDPDELGVFVDRIVALDGADISYQTKSTPETKPKPIPKK